MTFYPFGEFTIVQSAILLMEEILHHLGCINPANKKNDNLPTSTGAGFRNHQQYEGNLLVKILIGKSKLSIEVWTQFINGLLMPPTIFSLWSLVGTTTLARWWFQRFFIFTPIWGNDPILSNIFEMGWNHQLAWEKGVFEKPGTGNSGKSGLNFGLQNVDTSVAVTDIFPREIYGDWQMSLVKVDEDGL